MKTSLSIAIRRHIRLLAALLLMFGLLGTLELAVHFGEAQSWEAFAGPSQAHWLGTTSTGQDVVGYLRQALWRSIAVAAVVTLPTLAIAYLVGGLWALSRAGSLSQGTLLVIVLTCLGPTPLVLTIAIIYCFPGPGSLLSIIVAMIAVTWPPISLRLRSEMEDLAKKPWFHSAQEEGAGTMSLLLRELLPAMAPVLEKFAFLVAVGVIETEALLGFLGVAGASSSPSLGRMLQMAGEAFYADPPGVHALRLIGVAALSLGSLAGSFKLFFGWRNDRRLARAVPTASGEGVIGSGAGWTVSAHFRTSGHPMLRDVFVPYLPGHITVVAGGSGSGKSLTVKSLVDVLPYDITAQVECSPDLASRRIVLLPQGLNENFYEGLTCGEYLQLLGVQGDQVNAVLGTVGLCEADLRTAKGTWKRGSELNGGTAQKLALALALRSRPDVLILDETIAALDHNSASNIGGLLRRILADQPRLAVIVVNHRPDWTKRFADDVLFIAHGVAIYQGSSRDFWKAESNPRTPAPIKEYLRAARRLEAAATLPTSAEHDLQTEPDRADCALRVRDLRLSFGKMSAVSFDVRAGEIVAFAGENGIGKSTLLKTLASRLPRHSGTIEFPAWEACPDRTGAVAVGLCGQNPVDSLNPYLQVHDILRQSARRRGIPEREIEQAIAEACRRVELDVKNLDKRCLELSGGQRARAGLARALLGNPRILLLDEPTAGLDPEIVVSVLDAVRRLADEQGVTVLLVAHDIEHCNYIGARQIRIPKQPALAN